MKSDFGNEYRPRRATDGSAGYDLVSPVDMHCTPVNAGVAGYYKIDTGLHLEDGDIRKKEAILILPRSGYGVKTGFYLANTMGLIDSDYRDSIKVFFNIRHGILDIKKGDRIAQFIIVPVGRLKDELPPSLRERRGGFGSTGE